MKSQPSLFDTVNKLPDDRHYPTNLDDSTKVGKFLYEDFEASNEFLIITGFSSIEFLANFFSKVKMDNLQRVRIVLGTEPLYRSSSKGSNLRNIAESIVEYWLERRISAMYCWPVLNLMQLIRSGQVEFRVLDGLHAKVYIGQLHAMLGSSNFSFSGLFQQKEGNVRVGKTEHPEEYGAFSDIGEEYYNRSLPANHIILDILGKLIKYTGWKEVVARAAGELLEGDSVRDGQRIAQIFQNLHPPLWGIQEEAVGQALYVLDNFGSVLIADPTGSGKTRMGVALNLCLKNRMLLNGAMPFEDNSLLISPPIVRESWANEFTNFGSDFSNILSQGALSGKNEVSPNLIQKIENARVIFLDEAHNFLNKSSKRSNQLQANQADHLILLTATPINKRVEDIFRLLEIMDIDNLDDEAIQEYIIFKKSTQKGKNLTAANRTKLRAYLSQYMVRRTKQEINRRVADAPERHTLPGGMPCRYPKQRPGTYPLYEKEEDILIAREINKTKARLKGLVWLRSMVMKGKEYVDVALQETFLEMRLVSSKALAQYYIEASLGSSNLALIEHIVGTISARKFAEETLGYILGSLKENRETGNMIQKIEGFQDKLPKHNLDIQLPIWMSDPEAYIKACQEEISNYLKIVELGQRLSITREHNKVSFICGLLDIHQLVLSFDRNIISLHLLFQIMKERFPNKQPLLVTGNEKANQKAAQEYFGRGSKEKNRVALCSDVMSEGVNLQQASAIVMLDMPGVMRIAEQRVGRIDRMNSPHEEVYVYFPDDSPEFGLRTDRKLYKTATMVEDMIGGNLDLPDSYKEESKLITGAEIAEDYAKAQEEAIQTFSDGIQDAFQTVRELVYGDEAIIEEALYKQIRYSKTQLGSFIKPDQASFVVSKRNWAFFCMKATTQRSAYWIYFEEKGNGNTHEKATSELPVICRHLREHVSFALDIKDQAEIAKAMTVVKAFFDRLCKFDIEGLPNKKRRGIKLLQKLIGLYIKKEKVDQGRLRALRKLNTILEPTNDSQIVDYYLLAKNWIRAIHPYMAEEKKKTSKIIHLAMMYEVFKKDPLPTSLFEKLLEKLTYIDPADKRVAAYIIGIKE